MSRKPIYKLVDMKGRILIPKELRDQGRINYGDIVRLGLSEGKVTVNKVKLWKSEISPRKLWRHLSARQFRVCRKGHSLKCWGNWGRFCREKGRGNENIHRTGLSGAWVAGILERQSYCHKTRSCSERYRGTAFCMYGGRIFV